jgi:hypothetical protein
MRKLFLGLLPVLLIVLTSRCTLAEDIEKLKGAIDSLNLVVSTPSFETGIHLEFINGKTKDYVNDAKIEVTVSGQNAAYVYNNLGIKENPFTTGLGLMELVIDPRQVDTTTMKTSPLVVDLTITADGYNPVTQRVRLFSEGMKKYSITMIKLNDAPEGVTVASKTNFISASINGKTLTPSTVTMNSGEQSISIAPGVTLKDENGKPVTGAITASVVYFDPVSQEAQDAFPGGLNVSAQMDDDSVEEIQFVSAGMFDVRLTAGGTSVKSFEDGGITLRTTVPETLINPNTGQPIKENDVIELWSLDEGSGQWKFEKMDTVRLEKGELILEETVTHLSMWNWDFFWNACSNGPRFIWRGNLSKEYNYVSVSSKMANTFYNYNRTVTFNTRANNYFNNLQLYNVPRNVATTFTFSDAGWDPTRQLSFNPSTINISNMCNGEVHFIDVTEAVSTVENITVNLEVSASSASNQQLIIRPNATMYYRQLSGFTFWNYMYLRNGKTSIVVQLGRDYQLAGSFGNYYGYGNLKVENIGANKLKLTITPTIQFGTGSQTGTPLVMEMDKPTNNEITVKYNAELPDNIFNQLRTRAAL